MSDKTEQTSRQTSENQTLHITTRVADIRLTAVLADSEQHDSSDEEVIEALGLYGPTNPCNDHSRFTLVLLSVSILVLILLNR